ncbi:hypothetical protein NW767_006687 [Fusarium falciforme]|nr:hypothetical protein NW767_006687 [Fusarium falciforme]
MSLSIGIEIEGVAMNRVGSSAPFPTRTEVQLRLLSDALDDAGLESRVYLPSTTRGSGPDYSIWNVTMDVTVSEATSGSEAEDSKFRRRFGFELISPVFRGIENNAWMNQLRAGISSINRVVRWKANRSTGLHVHVGRDVGSLKYSLLEVKKIAMLYCRFEGAIDEFHPGHRSFGNDYIMSNRNNALLDGLSISQVYERIFRANSILEVCQVVNYCDDEYTYDGYNDSRFFKKHDTIEFRQHEGTTDPEQMIKWARFIIKFVGFAMVAPLPVITAPGESFQHLHQLIGPREQ